MYDFHKVKSPNNEHVYTHPLFICERPDLLKEIRRKTAENGLPLVSKNSKKTNMNPVIQKLIQFHKKNVNYESHANNLENKVNELVEQNRILANQLWNDNERMKNIETVLMIFADCMKNGKNEEFFSKMPVSDHSFVVNPCKKIKKPEFNQILTPSYSVFEEEFNNSTNKNDINPESPVLDNHYETFLEIEKVDSLFEN